FFQAEDGIRDFHVTGVQTCALPISLARTGRYSHPGFLAAYGEWQFSRLEDFAPYGEIWAPYYTCHKIMAGLLDAHELTGSDQAQIGRASCRERGYSTAESVTAATKT